MPKASNSAWERSSLRWEEPPAGGSPANRPARLIALSLGLAVTFAGGVAAAMLALDPAEAQRQAQAEPLKQVQPAQAAAVGPTPAAQPSLPVKKVKTVTVLAKAAAAPPKPAEPASSVQPSATPEVAAPPPQPAAAMDLNRLVAPTQERWASNLAAVQAGSAAIDEESRTSAAIDQARFAAASMLPLVAEPMLDAPSAESEEVEAAEPEKAQRKARMARSANLRARPANGGRTLGVLSAGTSIALFGCGKGWCEVSADGRRGFVAERFLKGKAAPPKRKKAARKKAKAQAQAAPAEAPAEAEKLPGVFPEPVIPAPSDR